MAESTLFAAQLMSAATEAEEITVYGDPGSSGSGGGTGATSMPPGPHTTVERVHAVILVEYHRVTGKAPTPAYVNQLTDRTKGPESVPEQLVAIAHIIRNENKYNVDTSFIERKEGKIDHVYLPKDGNNKVLEHSGATIGVGIDLGQQSRESLQAAGVDQSTIDKLAPYFGMQGDEADKYVQQHPLTLSDAELSQLDTAFITKQVSKVASFFNGISGRDFADLSLGTKTALVSIYYQYPSTASAPTFWGDVGKLDWQKAVSDLNNFYLPGAHPPPGDLTRRGEEASFISNDIAAGEMHAKGL
ncbi:hypothetical protein AA12717_3077 [Gluconacetobacter sacchari DSM 12717]|uniref:Pesticin C-terminal domain-containing protein n=1 Tax=Gluconacetobacter sacchari DSM 12717 TaxID=1307940 RepID=A0ABQ0PAG6_9PROT|nr:hypothetical protein AA12717_3077 [Gluconacetobacter sacchari DSM 12717]